MCASILQFKTCVGQQILLSRMICGLKQPSAWVFTFEKGHISM